MLTNGDICACKFTQSGAETVSHEFSDHSATTGNFGEPCLAGKAPKGAAVCS